MTEFKPGYDAFPTSDVFESGEDDLDAKFLKLQDELFGQLEGGKTMEALVREYKAAIQREGLVVPGKKNALYFQSQFVTCPIYHRH